MKNAGRTKVMFCPRAELKSSIRKHVVYSEFELLSFVDCSKLPSLPQFDGTAASRCVRWAGFSLLPHVSPGFEVSHRW